MKRAGGLWLWMLCGVLVIPVALYLLLGIYFDSLFCSKADKGIAESGQALVQFIQQYEAEHGGWPSDDVVHDQDERFVHWALWLEQDPPEVCTRLLTGIDAYVCYRFDTSVWHITGDDVNYVRDANGWHRR